MTINVRLFLRGMRSEELTWLLERQTPGMRNGCYAGIRFINGDDYHYAILLNEGQSVLAPSERTACFLMEPPEKFRPELHPAIGTLFSFNPADSTTFRDRFVHQHMYSLLHAQVLRSDQPLPSLKTRFMSMVVSGKGDLPFARKRLELAKALLNTDLDIDFFGRDFQPNSIDHRIKGPLPRLDKTAALRDYTYSLGFENSPQDGYLTEKFFDCLVNNCAPITNNRTPLAFFPADSFVYLDFSDPVEALVESIADRIRHRRMPNDVAVLAAKHQVLSGSWCLAQAITDFVMSAEAKTKNRTIAISASPIIDQEQPVPHPPASPSPLAPSSNTIVGAPRSTPLVTVLFLTRNRMHYLRQTVASIREHLHQIEPDLPVSFVCLDNGSSAADRVELAGIGFDVLILSAVNIGIGPAMNHLVSMVRSPFLLNLQDDWIVTNPKRLRFLSEAIAIMESDPNIGHLKLDNYHFLNFNDRQVYDGPFTAANGSVPFYCQNPHRLWGGFCFPPALTRTAALHELGPFREDQPFQRGWAESEYTQRYATKYFAAKSPAMTIFTHIGEEPTKGWNKGEEPPKSLAAGVESTATSRPTSTPASFIGSIAFIIPYREDSPERAENLQIVTAYLQRMIKERGWQAEIIIEQPDAASHDQVFSKTRLINSAVRRSTADIVAIIDADALIPERQLVDALGQLSAGADFSYPHQGAFLNVPRPLIQRIIDDGHQLDCLTGEALVNLNPGSFGGAVLFRRSSFWGGGGYNERFRSWGREDVEIHDRFVKLGYTCQRVAGPLFHLDHPRTSDSRPDNPHYIDNIAEHDRILHMDRSLLMDEVQSWDWVDA